MPRQSSQTVLYNENSCIYRSFPERPLSIREIDMTSLRSIEKWDGRVQYARAYDYTMLQIYCFAVRKLFP
jgi:hypothetical protein